MAHLWVPLDDGTHAVLGLEKAEYELPVRLQTPAAGERPRATLVRFDSGGSWALVVARNELARVNGVPLAAGLAVLDDRDEIRLPGLPPLWFSTETLARIGAAPTSEGRELRCPRCMKPIVAGSPAVLCPACGVWQHQSSERPCFTYWDAPCAACGERFGLDDGFRWTPAEL